MVDPGLVVVDKSPGMTSHDVVARVRRLAGTRKVGHAGTLDPMATGVLVLGVDRATRLRGQNPAPVAAAPCPGQGAPASGRALRAG